MRNKVLVALSVLAVAWIAFGPVVLFDDVGLSESTGYQLPNLLLLLLVGALSWFVIAPKQVAPVSFMAIGLSLCVAVLPSLWGYDPPLVVWVLGTLAGLVVLALGLTLAVADRMRRHLADLQMEEVRVQDPRRPDGSAIRGPHAEVEAWLADEGFTGPVLPAYTMPGEVGTLLFGYRSGDGASWAMVSLLTGLSSKRIAIAFVSAYADGRALVTARRGGPDVPHALRQVAPRADRGELLELHRSGVEHLRALGWAPALLDDEAFHAWTVASTGAEVAAMRELRAPAFLTSSVRAASPRHNPPLTGRDAVDGWEPLTASPS